MTDLELSVGAADLIAEAYLGLEERFETITGRAKLRFENRDWAGMADDALERLTLHGPVALAGADRVKRLLGVRSQDREMWKGLKGYFSLFANQRPDFELTKTFYNTVNRRVMVAPGVDPEIQFVEADFDNPHESISIPNTTTHTPTGSIPDLICSILESCGFSARFRDVRADSDLVAERIMGRLDRGETLEGIELASPVFYRGKGAYLVGRLITGSKAAPLALALVHKRSGISVDAVLLTENDVSILFSFAHSYFHVENRHPRDLVRFINEIVPRKRQSELYISLGRVRHGKSELFRELRGHLASTTDLFVEAPGKRGSVMSVFTLPNFEMVFKVIRDHIPAQKSLTPSQVMEKYRLVFRHDRAGRLVDSQYFERLELPTSRFDPRLLESLLDECSRSVRVDGDQVEIDLAYVQRRVIPLDVHLKETAPGEARHAVLDYGNAIRDLAVTGIFPGDLLLKNFGVTRHDRVVFYDYDELTELGNITFRDVPVATHPDDEIAAEPWFPLGPDDVFPSEFGSFLGMSGMLRETFLEHHSDLLEASWWKGVQRRIEAGDIVSIYPYAPDRRL